MTTAFCSLAVIASVAGRRAALSESARCSPARTASTCTASAKPSRVITKTCAPGSSTRRKEPTGGGLPGPAGNVPAISVGTPWRGGAPSSGWPSTAMAASAGSSVTSSVAVRPSISACRRLMSATIDSGRSAAGAR